ncbi:hypothetical protein ACQYAD_10625 [Neobacillus sp. SM06]|uniref:hypothetical protein n=1 Tax=Neobacillus sp. SM06 TaxID=3422492 RepID=UPI003D26E84F
MDLEKKVSKMETFLKEKQTESTPKKQTTPEKKEEPPTIHIENIQIDKVVIEKLDYANNFGQLGIKDLSGKLNIGTSFEGDIAKAAEEKINQKAKVQIRAKKEET